MDLEKLENTVLKWFKTTSTNDYDLAMFQQQK